MIARAMTNKWAFRRISILIGQISGQTSGNTIVRVFIFATRLDGKRKLDYLPFIIKRRADIISLCTGDGDGGPSEVGARW